MKNRIRVEYCLTKVLSMAFIFIKLMISSWSYQFVLCLIEPVLTNTNWIFIFQQKRSSIDFSNK